MPSRIEPGLVAPCGIDCMACYAHLRDKKPCSGCLVDDRGKTDRCRNCAIKSCARERGITYCHECGGFPCARIVTLDRSYRKRYAVSLVAHAMSLSDVGVDAYLEAERVRWTCTECGGVVSLHDAECSECRSKSATGGQAGSGPSPALDEQIRLFRPEW
jgi:hypothetical protein